MNKTEFPDRPNTGEINHSTINLAEFIDQVLSDVNQNTPNTNDKKQLMLGSMDLREWVRQQRYKIERLMEKKRADGEPHSFEVAYSSLKIPFSFSNSPEEIYPSCAIVTGVTAPTAEMILFKIGLLNNNETLQDFKKSDRWRRSGGWNNSLGGTYQKLEEHPNAGGYGHTITTQIKGLLVGVVELFDYNTRSSVYQIHAYFQSIPGNDRLRTMLEHSQKSSPFDKK